MSEYGNTETNYFTQPKELKEEVQREKSQARAGLKLLEEIIEHFDERIEHYKKIDSIGSDVETDPEVHLRQVVANQQTIINLTNERDYLVGLRESIKR